MLLSVSTCCCCCCLVTKLWCSITLCNPTDCSTPGLPVLHYLPEFAQTLVHWVGDFNPIVILSLSLLLPSIFPIIRVFSSESAFCIRWSKYWRFGFCMNPLGLISFRIDWFDLLAVLGTLKNLLLKECVVGPSPCRSKANKQASLVERKVCFFSDTGHLQGLGQTSVQRPTPRTDNQWERAFLG